jgi:hypothetical protein
MAEREDRSGIEFIRAVARRPVPSRGSVGPLAFVRTCCVSEMQGTRGPQQTISRSLKKRAEKSFQLKLFPKPQR